MQMTQTQLDVQIPHPSPMHWGGGDNLAVMSILSHRQHVQSAVDHEIYESAVLDLDPP